MSLLMRDPDYREAVLDRVQRGVIPHANHACVLLWSMGNESAMGRTSRKPCAGPAPMTPPG